MTVDPLTVLREQLPFTPGCDCFMCEKRSAALAAVEQLLEAARFYADADNYDTRPLSGSEDRYGVPLTACPIEDDCGELARAALARFEGDSQPEGER